MVQIVDSFVLLWYHMQEFIGLPILILNIIIHSWVHARIDRKKL